MWWHLKNFHIYYRLLHRKRKTWWIQPLFIGLSFYSCHHALPALSIHTRRSLNISTKENMFNVQRSNVYLLAMETNEIFVFVKNEWMHAFDGNVCIKKLSESFSKSEKNIPRIRTIYWLQPDSYESTIYENNTDDQNWRLKLMRKVSFTCQ